MEATYVFCKGKPTVFGTAFDRKQGFKTENLIKYRIQWRCGDSAFPMCPLR